MYVQVAFAKLMLLVTFDFQEGFHFHHAEHNYLMLVRWISETTNNLPANASHRVGIGAFVMNSNLEVLSKLILFVCDL